MSDTMTSATVFGSEATLSPVPEWLRLVIRSEFAPWSLSLYVTRRWLSAPEQEGLSEAADELLRRRRLGECASSTTAGRFAVVVPSTALALRCSPGLSVLTLFGNELAADTGRRPRNLSVNGLVRLDDARDDDLYLTLINGAVRIENLSRRPTIFDGTADPALIWPTPGDATGGSDGNEPLDALLLGSTDVHVDLSRDIDERLRFRYQRTLADGRRLWMMVGCPFHAEVVAPQVEAKNQVDSIKALLSNVANGAVQLEVSENTGAIVYATTSYRTCTTLTQNVAAGALELSTRHRVRKGSRIVLGPGTRFEESVVADDVSPEFGEADAYRITPSAPLRHKHPRCEPVRTEGEREVRRFFQVQATIALVNADGTRTHWRPRTFYLRDDEGAGSSWAMDGGDPFDDDSAPAPTGGVAAKPLALKWDAARLSLLRLPELQLTGADNRSGDNDYLWQPAIVVHGGTPEPAALVRLRFAATEARVRDTADARFDRPLGVEWEDDDGGKWTIEGRPLDAIPGRPSTIELRVFFTVPVSTRVFNRAVLTLSDPEVLVRSPATQIYAPPAPEAAGTLTTDPGRPPHSAPFAYPALRLWRTKNFVVGSLHFRNLRSIGKRRVWTTIDPDVEQRLRFEAHDAVRIYRPRGTAVIDLASVARPNVTALNVEASPVARDPSHGLIAFEVEAFCLASDDAVGPTLELLDPRLGPPDIARATLALHPWVEVAADGTLSAAHRNLILEMMEYELAGRFGFHVAEEPPADFLTNRAIAAVRGRYTLASDSLVAGTPGELKGWLPGVDLNDGTNPITPTLTWLDAGTSPPVLDLDDGIGAPTPLSIESQPDRDFSWLHLLPEWRNPGSARPEVTLTAPLIDGLGRELYAGRNTRNGGIPWLFPNRTVRPAPDDDLFPGVLAAAGNGRLLAVGTAAGAHVWPRRAEAALITLPHDRPVVQVAIAPDGVGGERRVITVTDDGSVHGWDVATPGEAAWSEGPWVAPVDSSTTRIAVHSDGRLVVGGADGSVRIVDGATGTVETAIVGLPVVFAAWFEEGGQPRVLIVESDGGSQARAYDEDLNETWHVPLAAVDCAAVTASNADGKFLWTVSGNNLVRTPLPGGTGAGGSDPVVADLTRLTATTGHRLSIRKAPEPVIFLTALRENGELHQFTYLLASNTLEGSRLPDYGAGIAIRAVAMPASAHGAVGWAGLADGRMVQWDANTGTPISSTHTPPAQFLDNVGAVRATQPAVVSDLPHGRFRVDRAELAAENGVGNPTVAKSFTGELTLALFDAPIAGASPRITDIRLKTFQPTVDENKIVLKADSALPDAGYVFYSKVRADAGTKVVVDDWPRLAGAPFRVTRLLNFDCVDGVLKELTFEAVFPAPTEVAEADDASTEPALVADSVRRKNVAVITMKVTVADPEFPIVALNQIDVVCQTEWRWDFPPPVKTGFPAKQFTAGLLTLRGALLFAGGRLAFRAKSGDVDTLGVIVPLEMPLPDLFADGDGKEFGYASETWVPDVEFDSPVDAVLMTVFASPVSLFAIAADGTGEIVQLDLYAERVCRRFKRQAGAVTDIVKAAAARPRKSNPADSRVVPHLVVGDANGGVWRIQEPIASTSPGTIEMTLVDRFVGIAPAVRAVGVSAVDDGLPENVKVFAAEDNIVHSYPVVGVSTYVAREKVTCIATAVDAAPEQPVGFLLAGCEGGDLSIFKEGTAAPLFQDKFGDATITALAITDLAIADGIARLLVGHSDGWVRYFQIMHVAGTFSKLLLGEFATLAGVASLSFASVDGREGCIAAGVNGRVRSFRLDPPKNPLVLRFSHDLPPMAGAVPTTVAPGGAGRIVSISADGEFQVFAAHPQISIRADLERPSDRPLIQVNARLDSLDLGVPAANPPKIAASVKADARLDLRWTGDAGSFPALPALVENGTYAFVAQVQTDDWSEGGTLLALRSEPSTGIGMLGGCVLTESVELLQLKVNGKLDLEGWVLNLQYNYSVPNHASGLLEWDFARFCGGVLKGNRDGDSDEVELLLSDQLTTLRVRRVMQKLLISGVLHVKVNHDRDGDGVADAIRFQAPIALAPDAQTPMQSNILAALKDTVFLPEPLIVNPTNAADVIVPLDRSLFWGGAIPSSAASDVRPSGPVLLRLDNAGLTLSTFPTAALPYDPCLESGAQAPVPLQPDWVPRLVHRIDLGGFLNVRVAALTPIEPAAEPGGAFLGDPDVDIWNLKLLAFDAQASFAGILAYAVDAIVPDKFETNSDLVQTENVFVLHSTRLPPDAELDDCTRIQRRFVPLTGLLNITETVSTSGPESPPLLTIDDIRSRMLKKGATGTAVHRIVRPGERAVFRWIASPSVDSAVLVSDTKRLVADAPRPFQPSIDLRSLQPATARCWSIVNDHQIADARGLAVFESNVADDAVEAGWRRNICLTWQGEGDELATRRPSVRVVERPIWNDDEGQPGWLRPPIVVDRDTHDRQFLPQYLEIWGATEKAGSMFVQSVGVLWSDRNADGSSLPPMRLTPTAIGCSRDPQQFIVPEEATIEILGDPSWSPNPVGVGGRDLTVSWKETLCGLPLNPLELSDSLTIDFDLGTGDYSLELQPNTERAAALISRVHERLFATTPEAPDLPIAADGVRPRPDLYLVSKIGNLDDPRPATNTATLLEPKVTLEFMDASLNSIHNFRDVFVSIPSVGTHFAWKMKDDFVNRIAWYDSPDKRVTAIALVFTEPNTDDPEVDVVRTDVRPAPGTPLAAKTAVILTVESGGTRIFERTCLFGDAASSEGIAAVDARDVFLFSRQDHEEVTVFPPASLPSGAVAKVYLVKTFGDGAVLSTNKNIP